MRQLAVLTLTATLYSAIAVEAQDVRPGAQAAAVEIASSCAEMWGARTQDELDAAYKQAGTRLASAFDEAARAYYETNVAYEQSREDYEAAYDRVTMSIGALATQGIDLATQGILEKLMPKNPEDTLTELDLAIELGADGVARLLEFNRTNTANDALLEEQFRFKADMVDRRKAFREVEAQFDKTDAIMRAIDSCAEDQQAYLRRQAIDAGQAAADEAKTAATPPTPKVETPTPPPQGPGTTLPRVGEMSAAGVGFSEVPARLVPVSGPQECRDICLRDEGCMAWNFTPPYDLYGNLPARCELYDAGTYSFTAARLPADQAALSVSGFGPAAVQRGWALAQ